MQWLLFGWPLTVCAMFPLGLFYGREISQEGRKAVDRLMISHGDLWRHPREALACLWPGCWSWGNRLDFVIPAMALSLVTAVELLI